jgi:hypothetical protein
MLAGLSTLGVKVSVGFETVAGQKPTDFVVRHRINSIGGISIEPETIDASAIEDLVERSVAGRASSGGGQFTIGVNVTDETIQELEEMQQAYEDKGNDVRMWFQISSPYITKAWFVAGQPPLVLPMPAFDQNALLTNEIPITIDEYIGLDTKVAVA